MPNDNATSSPVIHPTGLSEPNEIATEENVGVAYPTGLSEPNDLPGDEPSYPLP